MFWSSDADLDECPGISTIRKDNHNANWCSFEDEVNGFYNHRFKDPAVNDCRFCSVCDLRVVNFLIIKALDMMMVILWDWHANKCIMSNSGFKAPALAHNARQHNEAESRVFQSVFRL